MIFFNTDTTTLTPIYILFGLITFVMIFSYFKLRPTFIVIDKKKAEKLRAKKLMEAGSDLYLTSKLEAEQAVKSLKITSTERSRKRSTSDHDSFYPTTSRSSNCDDDFAIGMVAGAFIFGVD